MSRLNPTCPPEWQSPAGSERRRDPRSPARLTTGTLQVPDPQHRVSAVEITDLSLHGVGFTTDDALVIGQLYTLQIQGNWMNLSSRVRVVSCRAGQVGAEFC